jgi:hypothetical protein
LTRTGGLANSTCQPFLTARFIAGMPRWASAAATPPGVTITVGCSRPPAAARLRRLRSVPSAVLADAVAERGACMTLLIDEQPPGWLFDSGTDREVAARLCAGCPVQSECLELELRLFGEQTVGV